MSIVVERFECRSARHVAGAAPERLVMYSWWHPVSRVTEGTLKAAGWRIAPHLHLWGKETIYKHNLTALLEMGVTTSNHAND